MSPASDVSPLPAITTVPDGWLLSGEAGTMGRTTREQKGGHHIGDLGFDLTEDALGEKGRARGAGGRPLRARR